MRSLRVLLCAVMGLLFFSCSLMAQTESATVSGFVSDTTGAAIVGAKVQLTNVQTNIVQTAQTNTAGLYLFPSVKPGEYRLSVNNAGFKEAVRQELVLHVQDTVSQNFKMEVGSANETISVVAEGQNVNTSDGTVSTVVDRNFAENLPLNGRSFQTLVQLTPGVVTVAPTADAGGQFSINGQRASSNYWTVDGVGANIGMSSTSLTSNGAAGALGSFSALGGTNSLVSVDALQEFRIETSSFAPEFGRTPGGQISIITRSGTNQFHGSLFDYLRNDILDANDWFNGFTNNPPLPKAEERQNDFGGTVGGPIFKDRTFFFFSYEGLRLRLPQTALTTVPDLNARANAVPAMQSFLNSYPLPNGPDDAANGIAQFNASFSNPASLDAYSLRIDHHLSDRLNLFGRYSYSPSAFIQRGASSLPLNGVLSARTKLQTGTIGATWSLSNMALDEARVNFSRVDAFSANSLDDFGGATPVTSPPFPSPFSTDNSAFAFSIFSLSHGGYVIGRQVSNAQRQVNFVDTLSLQKGTHSFKFGADVRRLSPTFASHLYDQTADFFTVGAAATGSPFVTFVSAQTSSTLLFRNVGLFAQDTWRASPRLSVNYGVRWDIDYAPSSLNGPSLAAVTGFDLHNLANLALAPSGTPPFRTPHGGIAPRIGVAYELSQSKSWQTVLRGGVGLFYDLATSEIGNLYSPAAPSYPFGATNIDFGGSFPLTPAAAAPPPISAAQLQGGTLSFVDPHLTQPHFVEWNVAVEQAIGQRQSLSLSYIGAVGRKLLQTAFVFSPNSNFGGVNFVANTGTSDYHALQLQFQRPLAQGLQVLSSYTWSHSIDTGSAGAIGLGSNALVPSLGASANRGPSDFDIRNAFSAGITYQLPAFQTNEFARAIVNGWSLEAVLQARSAAPVDVTDLNFFELNGAFADVRPDLVPGQPIYLRGPQYPGGKAFNPNAFTDPPSTAGSPLRQGDIPRNFLRGFGATQVDLAVHRDFPIREKAKLQFRCEIFNSLNHPNFAPPSGLFGLGSFGISNQTLAQSLSGGAVSGGLNGLYQIGGPRSIQVALKLSF